MNNNLQKTFLLIASLLSAVILSGCQPRQQTQSTDQFVTAGQPISEAEIGEPSELEQSGRYIPYQADLVVESAQNGTAVLFFHASWCPTCQATEKDIIANLSQIPSGLTIFKTDYDTEDELKKKYGITYQHTFVQVDEHRNEVAKWNGGGLEEITRNVL